MNIRSFVVWSFFSVLPVALLSSPLHERVTDLLSVQYQHDALAEEIAHSFSNSEKKQLVDTLLTTALHRKVVMPRGNGLWWFALPFAVIIDFMEGLSHANNRNFYSRPFGAVSRLLDSANQAKEFSASIDTLNDLNTLEVQSKALATGLTVGAVGGLCGAAFTQSSLGGVIFFIASAVGGGVFVSALNTGSAQLGEVASDVFANTSALN